jgi:hypothetical protein
MDGYKDPSKETLMGGRAMSDFMRKGPGGLQGVVVAPATAGGVPSNYDPQSYRKTAINVDPDRGQEVFVTQNDMTSDRVSSAVRAAFEQHPGADIAAVRERAAFALKEIARLAAEEQQLTEKTAVANKSNCVDETVNAVKQAAQEPPEHLDQPPDYMAIDRSYSPMAAFGLRNPPPPVNAISPPSDINRLQKVGPPQKLVYFEKEGIGTVPAFFHEVLVSVDRADPENAEQSGFMVLVYDLRFEQNAARWFPPSDDPYQRPWAVQINKDRRLYLVHTTGFQYVYDSREYCILAVERAVYSGDD